MRTPILLLSTLALTGCLVGKKKYDELQSLYDAAKVASAQELAAKDDLISQRDQKIEDLEAQVAELESAKKDLEARIATAEEELGSLQERNAQILKDRGALRGEVAQMKEALAELERRRARAEARIKDYKDLIGKFQSLIDAGTLEVKIVDGRMVVSMKTDVLFASGSAQLSDDGKAALAEVATILAGIAGRRFQVEGHTDNDPIATKQYPNNWYLASGRSIGVVEHMITSGMPPERISAAAFGEFRPATTNRTDDGKALNRRIEIVLVPDLSDLPGYEELKTVEK